jgi:single-strand DNA-binding protein
MSDLRLVAINRVLLSGRLTRDPELRYTPSGVAVMTFSLALNRRYKDQSGEWKEEVSFVNVVAWQRQAELASEYLKKGSAVFVEGRLQSRSWETSEGQKRSILEVRAERLQFLDRLKREEEEPTEGKVEDTSSEEVPF